MAAARACKVRLIWADISAVALSPGHRDLVCADQPEAAYSTLEFYGTQCWQKRQTCLPGAGPKKTALGVAILHVTMKASC